MKIGIGGINVGPLADPAAMQALAQAAEAAGVESLWTYEHVLMPTAFESRYPYHPEGTFPGNADTAFIDPFVALGHVAAVTARVRLGTGVNILSQANPLYLAKQAASVDVLSGGRLILGLGAGWLRQEFEALGVPFAARGRRMDDYLRALKAVWRDGPVQHRSEFIEWHDFQSRPLPVQQPHPPLVIGGHSAPALRRAARLGDGWFGFTRNEAELEPLLEQLRASCAAEQRDPATLEITALWNEPWDGPHAVVPFAKLGVSRLIVPLHRLYRQQEPDTLLPAVERLGRDVIARL